jgi:drug/metabolite transporter (DMT)-like permease
VLLYRPCSGLLACRCLRECRPCPGRGIGLLIVDRLTDVTAIWNTNAFFAYIISVRLFKLNWDFRKLLAVLIATFGVMAVVYGDVGQSELPLPQPDQQEPFVNTSEKPKAPVLGDLLTLCGSVGFGLYQVMYKRHAALPQDGDVELSAPYVPLSDSDGLSASELDESVKEIDDVLAYPPPFGLYPNFISSGIGLTTLSSLWIILPILHYSGYEQFRLPDNLTLVISIAGIAGSGLVLNAGLLVPIYFHCSVLKFDSLFALPDSVGYLGSRRCLRRRPPHDRPRSPIRHHDRARHECHYALELGWLRWDNGSIRHLGL